MLDSTVVVLSVIKTHQNEATTDHGPAPKLLQLGRSLEKLWSRHHLLRKYSVALRRIENSIIVVIIITIIRSRILIVTIIIMIIIVTIIITIIIMICQSSRKELWLQADCQQLGE